MTGLSNYAEALRSRSHEYLNKLHVISGLLRNKRYEELEEYLSQIIGSKIRETSSIKVNVQDPILVGLLESKFSRAHERHVTLTLGGSGVIPPLSPTGSHALVTILGNLVDNAFDAVSYTQERHIDLSVHCENDTLVITVADTGRGINEEHLPEIFKKGFSTKGAGRGIGLYMLLLTLDELDGSIEVDSHAGQGTSFTVHIPLAMLISGGRA